MKIKAKVESRKAKEKTQYPNGSGFSSLLSPSAFLLCCAMAVRTAFAQPRPAKWSKVIREANVRIE